MSNRQGRNNSFNAPDIRPVTVFIYGLADPGTWNVRYVGRSQDPRARISSHGAQSAASRVRSWMRPIWDAGKKPELVILRVVRPGGDSAAAELAEIHRLYYEGADLLNFHGVFNYRPTAPAWPSVADAYASLGCASAKGAA